MIKYKIASEVQLVREQVAILRGTEREVVSLHEGLTHELGVPSFPIVLRPDRLNPGLYLVCVSPGGRTPAIAQGLAVALITRDGTLAATARTDANGCCWIQLTPTECSLRFVNEVRAEIDVDILVELDDEDASRQLQAAFGDREIPESVQSYLRPAVERDTVAKLAGLVRAATDAAHAFYSRRAGSAAPIDALRLSGYADWTVPVAAAYAVGEFHSDSKTIMPMEPLEGDAICKVEGNYLRFRFPANWMPFGLTLCYISDHENNLVAMCPLAAVETAGFRRLDVSLRSLGIKDRTRKLCAHLVAATRVTAGLFDVGAVNRLYERCEDSQLRDAIGQFIMIIKDATDTGTNDE